MYTYIERNSEQARDRERKENESTNMIEVECEQ